MKKNCKKKDNKSNRVKDRKSNKERSGKLYIKCKGYNNFFHNWIGKKDLVQIYYIK